MCVGGRRVLEKKNLVGHTLGVPLPTKELIRTPPTFGFSVIAFMEDPALDLLCDSD